MNNHGENQLRFLSYASKPFKSFAIREDTINVVIPPSSDPVTGVSVVSP